MHLVRTFFCFFIYIRDPRYPNIRRIIKTMSGKPGAVSWTLA